MYPGLPSRLEKEIRELKEQQQQLRQEAAAREATWEAGEKTRQILGKQKGLKQNEANYKEEREKFAMANTMKALPPSRRVA